MKHSRKRLVIWAATIGAVSLLGVEARAQVAVQQQGRAQDANTRVGSGGVNDSVGRGTVSSNDIIYNNVTGNRGFRGPLAERDPQAFTGPIGGRLSDAFIRQSSAAPLPYQPTADALTPQPFFGSTRGVAPPLGSIREGYSGAYTGTSLVPQNPLDMSTEYSSAFSDWRTQQLGKSTVLGTRSSPLDVQPGEMILQGPLEANNQAVLFTGSPLYGVREFQAGAQATDTSAFSLYGQPGSADRLRFDESTLRQMRSELQGSALQQPQSPTDQQNPNNAGNYGQPQGQGNGQGNLNQSLESPDNSANNASVNASAAPGTFSNGTNTNQGLQRRSTIATPGQQMAQYDELQKRMQRYENPQTATIEQSHQFHVEQQRQGRTTAGHPAASQPSAYGSSLSPRALEMAARAGAEKPAKPLKITSLAAGVRFTGLRDVLTRAEEQMKQNKFQTAIETYDAAQKVAPNNWMIRLGRANAELGGGFYAQASDDIHEAYAYASALTLGQYDLNSMMQPQRVQHITQELKDLAAKNPKDEMPAFLLAYIAYNTGDEAQAAQYLSQAEERAHGQDALLKVLRQRWYLPEQGATPSGESPGKVDLNK